MKTHNVKIRPDRLNAPLATCFVGKLSSDVFVIGGDIPDDVDTITVQIGRTPDPNTHQPRPNYTAASTRQTDGTFSCYLSPFYFPEIAPDLRYHVVSTDKNGNPRWLGTGDLRILENPANGSSVAPEIIPADTYIRNPVTGLYHKLTAEVNEHGEVTVAVEENGVER